MFTSPIHLHVFARRRNARLLPFKFQFNLKQEIEFDINQSDRLAIFDETIPSNFLSNFLSSSRAKSTFAHEARKSKDRCEFRLRRSGRRRGLVSHGNRNVYHVVVFTIYSWVTCRKIGHEFAINHRSTPRAQVMQEQRCCCPNSSSEHPSLENPHAKTLGQVLSDTKKASQLLISKLLFTSLPSSLIIFQILYARQITISMLLFLYQVTTFETDETGY